MSVRRGAVAWRHGFDAETRACTVLEAEGWQVLARRARTEAGEIDIVVTRAGLLVFAEVKLRDTLADAARALSSRQRRRLGEAAALLLAANPHWPAERIRFDLLLLDRTGRMRRIADAFREGDG